MFGKKDKHKEKEAAANEEVSNNAEHASDVTDANDAQKEAAKEHAAESKEKAHKGKPVAFDAKPQPEGDKQKFEESPIN